MRQHLSRLLTVLLTISLSSVAPARPAGGAEALSPVADSPFGARGQCAMIILSQNLVVVRRGFDRESHFWIQIFVADVMNTVAGIQ